MILAATGGIGLIGGPVGLWAQHRRRDPALGDPRGARLDASFLALLLLTSALGLALLVLRH